MASLSNNTDIHYIDCTNEALNNSIHRKCRSKNENFDKNCSLTDEESNHKQKNGEVSFLNQNCNSTDINYTELFKNCKYYDQASLNNFFDDPSKKNLIVA